MRFNFSQWVASVQQKPEPVRWRYVLGCAGVVMLFVLGVWSLSVSESFRALSTDTREAAKGSQGLLPKATNFSLDSLLSGEKSLEERKKEVSGELFFQQQLEARTKPNFEEEGYAPRDPDPTDTSAPLPSAR